MALKFVKRAGPAKAQPRKVRVPRKSLLLSTAKPVVVKQDYAIDQFGELATRKRDAASKARTLGHELMPWHQRSNDPAGRWNAYCTLCNKAAIVCTEAPEGIPWVYGHALTDECPV